jgi:hypothetical protein
MEVGCSMRIPNERHLALDLRIHEIVPDFTLEDVWELPAVVGTAADFDRAVQMMLESDPAHGTPGPARFLWNARILLGRWLGLGDVGEPGEEQAITIPGTNETSLRGRLPADLQGTADGLTYDHLPFEPLFRTSTEYAAEVGNATVHGVMHLAWVTADGETYQGQMAVYVKPHGWFGKAYMAFIKPFRHLVVYPAAERHVARRWASRSLQ